MGINYPSFDKRETRDEYSKNIMDIFAKKHFNWEASPSFGGPYIFVRPNKYMNPSQLNTEAHPFLNIAKIGIGTKEGTLRLSIISYPIMNGSYSKKILEWIGYKKENIEGQAGLFVLAKPINLENIVRELKYVNCILRKK
jgi:hypothetical protein